MTRNRIVFNHRAGWMILAVLPLLGVGVGAIYAGADIEFVNPKSAKPGAGWALMALGLLSSTLAAGVITMRWDIVIDPKLGQVRQRRGAFGFNRRKTFELATFDRIRVDHGTVHSKYGAHPRYYLRLAGENTSVYLTEYATAQEAAGKAKEISLILDILAEADDKTRAALA